jgi:Na+-translocating ferredoxin:NAD+ oxidoreductase subunit B
MTTDVFQKLADYLNTLPGGFPPTESGVEIRILKRLFTPEEADLAANLTLFQETPAQVAARLNRDEAETEALLREMSKKGLILRTTKKDETLYMSAQFVIGIWEFHVNDLDEGLIKDFNEYVPHLFRDQLKNKTQQLRVVPISASISAEMEIMPYDAAEHIVKSQKKILVAPCICRREHKMAGEGCERTEEACLVFGGSARYYEENGLGRYITTEEALDILHKGMEEGLVLQPGNSQRPSNICMCCGCCCQILTNLKAVDAPAKVVNSSFYAAVDPDNCTACGVCEERCPMDAIAVGDHAAVNLDRCIGCGVCVGGCDFDAIHLIEKEEKDKWVPPSNLVETYMNIARERGLL